MEEIESAEKYKNLDKLSDEENLIWCINNVEKIDFSNEKFILLYEKATNYLMKDKLGNWNREDANMIVMYLAKKHAMELQIFENVKIKILEKSDYKVKYKNSVARCEYKENISNITYSSEIIDLLVGNTTLLDFSRGFQLVYHEICHAWQNDFMRKEVYIVKDLDYYGNIYRCVLETIARDISPEFYDDNYTYLFKEIQAESNGLSNFLDMIKEYNIKKYNEIKFIYEVSGLFKDYYELAYERKEAKLFGFDVDFGSVVDYICTKYIEKNPDTIQKYPVLKFAYNVNGIKKGIIQTIKERDRLIKENKDIDINAVNDIYKTVLNYRFFQEDEVSILSRYIIETGTYDEFILDILKCRLEKTKMKKNEKDSFIEKIIKQAESNRK